MGFSTTAKQCLKCKTTALPQFRPSPARLVVADLLVVDLPEEAPLEVVVEVAARLVDPLGTLVSLEEAPLEVGRPEADPQVAGPQVEDLPKDSQSEILNTTPFYCGSR